MIAKPPSRLPVFRFAGPRLHRGASTVVLGDAVHSVKPYFGLGVNSAFEDVAALADALDEETTLGGATAAFSAKRAAEARVLVELSRSFDRRGLAGFATFIGPIIMDAIFGKLPLVGKLFAPNTLALLQNPEYTYAMVRWRKRADRAVQLALLAAIGTGVGALLGAPPRRRRAGAAARSSPAARSRCRPPPSKPVAAAAPTTSSSRPTLPTCSRRRRRRKASGSGIDFLEVILA